MSGSIISKMYIKTRFLIEYIKSFLVCCSKTRSNDDVDGSDIYCQVELTACPLYKKKYDYIIPIGSNCRITNALKKNGLRKHSFPVDWTLTTMKCINGLFENDFEDFFNEESCKKASFTFLDKHTHNYVLNEKYNLFMVHESSVNNMTVEKYKGRINRLLEILNNPQNNILFVRNNLDGIILDGLHRHLLDREKDYFDFDAAHIEEFNSIIKRKYDFNYDILVINHKDSLIFQSDNIYNITSSVNQEHILWDQDACTNIIGGLNIKRGFGDKKWLTLFEQDSLDL